MSPALQPVAEALKARWLISSQTTSPAGVCAALEAALSHFGHSAEAPASIQKLAATEYCETVLALARFAEAQYRESAENATTADAIRAVQLRADAQIELQSLLRLSDPRPHRRRIVVM